MKVRALLLTMLLCATPAAAADVDGKWTGSLSTPNGDIAVSYEFKADGSTLTGSTMGPDGGQIAIKNGKIDGNKIAFTVTLDFGGMTLDIAYTGVVSPTQIMMMGDFAGMAFEFVVKKAS